MSLRPIERMKAWLKEDFPSHVDLLLGLSLDGSGTRPLLFDQVDVAIDSFGPDSKCLATPVVEDVHAGYVYLVSAIFCVDALVDQHPRGINNNTTRLGDVAMAGYLFLTGGTLRLKRAARVVGLPEDRVDMDLRFVISENMLALMDEQRIQSKLLDIQLHDDYQNIVGRANIFLFLFSFIAQLASVPFPPVLRDALADFLFFLQLGDDLGDWREDFLSGHSTSFIRECLNDIGKQPSIQQLEEYVYLSGFYERRFAVIINGLKKVLDSLKSCGCPRPKLIAYVEMQRDLSLTGLKCFIREKTIFSIQET